MTTDDLIAQDEEGSQGLQGTLMTTDDH
jgi:hypothetical protein